MLQDITPPPGPNVGASPATADDLRLAVVLDPALPVGPLANTAAVIAAGLGAATPALGGIRLVDATGLAFMNSANRPVPILQADAAAMETILARASTKPDGAVLVLFPAFARTLHDFDAYRDAVPARALRGEKIDGIGLCGPSKWVRSLTGSLKLLR